MDTKAFRQKVTRTCANWMDLGREWSLGGPSLFALLAVSLLIYNHVQEQLADLIFWLGMALIASVFAWMVQSHHKQARAIGLHDRRDATTGLANRHQFTGDLDRALAPGGERMTLVLHEFDGIGAYSDRYGYEAGDEVLRYYAWELYSMVNTLGGTSYRIDETRFSALVPADGHHPGEIIMAISATVQSHDPEAPIYRSQGEVTVPDEAADAPSALQIVGQRLAAYKVRQRRSAKGQAHDVLVAVLCARRPELRAHLRTVAFPAIEIGRRLGVPSKELDDIVYAAELQDIGLLTVPETTLEKATPLDQFETELIRGHPAAGAGIVGASPALASVAHLIRSSYEHFDGNGYPEGIAGEEIPLGSRIVAVCVAFGAMTAERSYRRARSPGDALAELRRCAGTQFDPRVVEALAADLALEPPAPAISEVLPADEPPSIRVAAAPA